MHLFSGFAVLAALLLLANQASIATSESGPNVDNLVAYLNNFNTGGQITAVLVTNGKSMDQVKNITFVVNDINDYQDKLQHLFSYAGWAWITPVMDQIYVDRKSSDEFDLLAVTADPEKQQGLVSYGDTYFYVMRNSTPIDVLSFYRLNMFTGDAAAKIEKMKPNENAVRQPGRLCVQFDVNAPPADVPPVCVDTGEQDKKTTELLAGFYSPNNVLVLFFFGTQKQVRVYNNPIANKSTPDEVYQYEQFITNTNRDSAWEWIIENWIICLLIGIITLIAIISSCALCCMCCCCRGRRRKPTKKGGVTKLASSTGKKSKKGSRLSSTGSRSGTSNTGGTRIPSTSGTGTSSAGTTART